MPTKLLMVGIAHPTKYKFSEEKFFAILLTSLWSPSNLLDLVDAQCQA